MKRLIPLILVLTLMVSCEKEQEEPPYSLKGRTYKAYSHIDSATGLKYYTLYQFIGDSYAKQYYISQDSLGRYIYSGGNDDSCTYELNYPDLIIYRHRYYYGGADSNNVFECKFTNYNTFTEKHNWYGWGALSDSILEYEPSDFTLTY